MPLKHFKFANLHTLDLWELVLHVALEVVPQVLCKPDDAGEGCMEQGRLHTKPDDAGEGCTEQGRLHSKPHDAGEGCTEQGRLHTKHNFVSVHFYLLSCPAFPL